MPLVAFREPKPGGEAKAEPAGRLALPGSASPDAASACAAPWRCRRGGFGFFTDTALRRLLVAPMLLHLAKDAFALHPLFEDAQRLVNVVVADEHLHQQRPFIKKKGSTGGTTPFSRECRERFDELRCGTVPPDAAGAARRSCYGTRTSAPDDARSGTISYSVRFSFLISYAGPPLRPGPLLDPGPPMRRARSGTLERQPQAAAL